MQITTANLIFIFLVIMLIGFSERHKYLSRKPNKAIISLLKAYCCFKATVFHLFFMIFDLGLSYDVLLFFS